MKTIREGGQHQSNGKETSSAKCNFPETKITLKWPIDNAKGHTDSRR